jgi:two-component system nitrate/nitrite response regulator NarL
MKQPAQIMLVEDHAGYREVIARILKREQSMELSGEYNSAEFALRALGNLRGKKTPDLILLDLNLPGMSGLEAISWFKREAPDSKIIILTQSETEADILQAIESGAAGYLLKSSRADQVSEGIQLVLDGGAVLDPGLASFILDTIKNKLPTKKIERALSDREMEILTLTADGMAKKEIAEQLGISTYTVVYHTKHIYEKLGVTNAPAAVGEAYRAGILPKD